MSGLFGLVDSHPENAVRFDRMAASLRRHQGQVLDSTAAGPFRIGYWRRDAAEQRAWHLQRRDDGLVVCLAGEIFSTRHPLPAAERPDATWCLTALAEAFAERGASALLGLNGDFQVAVWEPRSHRVTVAVDRFATTAMYWTATGGAFSFAHGVRGVIAGAGIPPRPDLDAIREAVTFGGYRLGSRTNIANVHALRPAETVSFSRGITDRAIYWSLGDLAASTPRSLDEAVDAVHAAWTTAVQRRLDGVTAPGQTLSGGRDSRVILGAAAPQVQRWQAITYGVPGCDDARFAEGAARAAGVEWRFAPLYGRDTPDWFERRTSEVQHSDGLIDLGDLMHLEHRSLLTQDIDCHLPGYIGDLVAGMTYHDIDTEADALVALSFTGASLAWEWNDALAALRHASTSASLAMPRALLLEHKLPQAIARPNDALAAWVRVRRPFLDLEMFETAMGVRGPMRERLYDRWVTREYPRLFRRIPVQKTGVPAGSSRLRRGVAGVGRELRRRGRAALRALGARPAAWSRNYTADEAEWSRPGIRDRITETILRPESLCCEIWDRREVTALLDRWFTGGGGSAKVVGALYVWETYHRDLSSWLGARTQGVSDR